MDAPTEEVAQEAQPKQSTEHCSKSDARFVLCILGISILAFCLFIFLVLKGCEGIFIVAPENRLKSEAIVPYIVIAIALFCLGLRDRKTKNPERKNHD